MADEPLATGVKTGWLAFLSERVMTGAPITRLPAVAALVELANGGGGAGRREDEQWFNQVKKRMRHDDFIYAFRAQTA